MSHHEVDHIIDELVSLDPTLMKRRKELERIVQELLQANPNVNISAQFRKELLSNLQMQMMHRDHSSFSSTMEKILFAAGGTLVGALAAVVILVGPHKQSLYSPEPPIAMEKSSQDFLPEDSAAPEGNVESSRLMRPQSGGGGGMAYGLGGGGMAATNDMMIAPDYSSIEYVYDGEIVLEDAESITGYKRMPLNDTQQSNLLGGTFVADLLNVSRLSGLHVQSVQLVGEGSEPLYASVDFREGVVSMNRQFDYSRRPESQCRDEACFHRYRLKERDMPSDEAVIAMANDFVRSMGIDVSQYGEPDVQDDWKGRLELTPNKEDFYFPEVLTVVYPYVIGGVEVYDEWGNLLGVNVSVDIREETVSGIWNLRTMDTVQEEYVAISDEQIIRDVIRRGGRYGYLGSEEHRNQAQLGEPKKVLVQQYDFDPATNMGTEVYVPALAFPVTKMPQNSYEYRKAIVVPLAEKFVQTEDVPLPVEPLPMPMMMQEEKAAIE